MSDTDSNPFDQALVYEGRVPLRWHGHDAMPSEGDVRRIEEENEKVLRYLTLLDDSHAESVDEEHGLATSDLKRIEFKLNVLLDLVGQMLARQSDMPPECPVRVGAQGLQWQTPTPTPPQVGAAGRVELFLTPRFPSPLILYGKVVSAEPTAEGEHLVSFTYEGLAHSVQALLEKLIFRQHRRTVAQSRRGGSDGPRR